MPYELECYIALLLIALLGLLRRPFAFLALILLVQVLLPIYDYQKLDEFSQVTRVAPRTLILCFLAGVGFYMFKEYVLRSIPLAICCLVLSYWLIDSGAGGYFIPIPIAYLTVVIGILNPPKAPIIFSGDYSYGMYLYAFPFQQLHMHLFPDNTSWVLNMAFAIPVTAIFAFFSWTLIEKPILRKRHAISTHVVSRLRPGEQ